MKKTLSIILVMLMVVCFAACGSTNAPPPSEPADSSATEDSGSTENTPAPSGDAVTLKLAHGHAPQSMTGQQYQIFADAVAELSGGSMAIEISAGGSLLTDPETLDGVMDGAVDIAHVMSSFASGTVKDIAPLEVYGYFSGDDWQGFLGKTRPIMEKIYEPFGVKFLGVPYQGELAFISTERLIKTPEDMKGLTFRSAGTWYGKCLELFGAAPTALPLAEMTTAFERGTVQGTVVGWNVSVPLSIYETAEFFSGTDTQTYYTNMLMNMDSWNKLTPEQQAIIEEATLVFEAEGETVGRQMIDEYISTIENNDFNTVYHLTAEEQKVFLDLVQPLYDQMDLSENGKELLQIVLDEQAAFKG